MEGERRFGATAARLRDAVRAAMTGMTLAPQLKGGGGGDGGGGGGVGPTPSVTDETFVREAVFSAVQATIGDKLYSHAHTEQWTNAIVEMLVMRLVSIDRDYKYVTTCMIVQKTGAGMRSATSCFWNAETDHGHSITMEHGDMYVITTIFVCKA